MIYNLKENIAYKILESRKAHKFISDIDQIERDITPILNEISIYFNNYTLHDINHSLRVLYNMCAIAGDSTLQDLSNLELAMIIYVALLHDVGMWVSTEQKSQIENSSQFGFYLKKNNGDKSLALQDFIRPIHGKRSYEYIMNDKEITRLLFDNDLSTVSFAEDVALICQSHMESLNWIDKKLKENFSKKYYYNSKYIALLLRIADYIDFDSQRAPLYLLEHKNLGYVSYMEWKKHAIVCNQEKIDEDTKEIFFDIECDDFNLYCLLMDTLYSMNMEISESVAYSKCFTKSRYNLLIKDKVRFNIVTKGFYPERFSFTIDYYKVTNLLMGENLYGDRRSGFRELLQNCFDACSVMKEYYLMHDPTVSYVPQVSIIYNFDDETVIIRDNGTGMSTDIIKNYFLTIGKSYYRSEEYGKLGYKIYPTGTFGIGFLACFMLSHNVTVYTKYYATGESSSFSLEKDSKYICYLDKNYSGMHGTAIALSMNEFNDVFSEESMLRYINKNFYCLNAMVNVYHQESGTITLRNQIETKKVTSFLNIDLSSYLEGMECKASLFTLIDEFRLYNSLLEVEGEDYNLISFSSQGIQLIHKDDIYEHSDKSCVILYSNYSFEELILQTFSDNQYFDNVDLDIDELIDFFEKYGFEVFDNTSFDPYLVEEKKEWWIDSGDAENGIPICVLWDLSVPNDSIKDILQKTKMRYLLDIGAIRSSWGSEGYIVNSTSVGEGVYPDELIMNYQPDNHITSYHTSVYYRGVRLKDVSLRIPHIANILTIVDIAVNILSDEFIPSVTRSKLTYTQENALAYAVGRAVHMYLLDLFSDDEDIAGALKNLFYEKYSIYSQFCRNINCDSV